MTWYKPDPPTPEIRAWKREHESVQAETCEVIFRIVEMTLVAGVVRYLENQLHPSAVLSPFLIAFAAIYARARLRAAFLPAIEHYDISERQKRQVYWASWGVAGVMFFAMHYAINSVVPLLAELQC